jgi:PTS system ascorbate-specific IIB component
MARLPEILTVCGVGYGTSLMLRMYIEDILADEGLVAKVAAWDSGTAKGQMVDIIVCADDLVSHLDGFKGRLVPIHNITDKKELREKFLPVFHEVVAGIEAKEKKRR